MEIDAIKESVARSGRAGALLLATGFADGSRGVLELAGELAESHNSDLQFALALDAIRCPSDSKKTKRSIQLCSRDGVGTEPVRFQCSCFRAG